MEFRTKGTAALQKVLSDEQSALQIENALHLLCVEKALKISDEKDLEKDYYIYLYQIIGDLLEAVDVPTILQYIQSKKIGWDHPNFQIMADKIAEQNDFIKNPFEVEEGVFQCKAINSATGIICGSRRVFSYTKQDRSCDEGTSVYCECVACKAKWRERG